MLPSARAGPSSPPAGQRSGRASVRSRTCDTASRATIIAGKPAGQPHIHRFGTPQGLFSYEILGLDGAGAHDLLQMARHGRILDWAGESQYYVEPKRLARLGYLAARQEPGKTRQRTVYTLTGKGLEALNQWARTPVRFTPVKSELLLRLLIAELVGEQPTRESITTLRDDISELFARLEESEARAETLPTRTKYLLLVFGFLRRLLDLHLEIVDELVHELTP